MAFNSVTEPIPPLRSDLELMPYEENGEQLLILRDPSGYGSEMIVFKPEAWALFSLFNGTQTISELQREIFRSTEVHVDAAQILDIVRMLDEYCFLDSPHFRRTKQEHDEQFTTAEVRPYVHAGYSYPEDPGELTAFLDDLFSSDDQPLPDDPPVGIIAPHIELRIGPDVYVTPFRHLASRGDIDTVVVLGTSHYSSEDLVIASRKHIQTPLGVIPADVEFIDTFHEQTGHSFTKNDIAHRQEHSIEFPAVFLRYLFGESVRIAPLLVSSLEECILQGKPPAEHEKFNTFVDGIRNTIESLNRKTAFVLSVDWSHVGRKFGDEKPASELLQATEKSDKLQLEALERGDYERFRALLTATRNETKIDGFSCISAFFGIAQPTAGKLHKYRQWHEEERESGVTFAGMSFFKSPKQVVD